MVELPMETIKAIESLGRLITFESSTPTPLSNFYQSVNTLGSDRLAASCGAYKFEGLGRHLFARVVGDHDVVQGLALVPLLAQLHALGVVRMG